jgi:hypothetical protein
VASAKRKTPRRKNRPHVNTEKQYDQSSFAKKA